MINKALCLPAPTIEALMAGQTVAAILSGYLEAEAFALYPVETLNNLVPTKQWYHSHFLPTAQKSLAEIHPDRAMLKAWARCELCQIIDDSEPIEALSRFTIWTAEALQKILAQQEYIFLAYLRVYHLPQPLEVSVKRYPEDRFVPLVSPLDVSQTIPVLSDRKFAQRRQQLEQRQPPRYPELELLQGMLAKLESSTPGVKALEQDIQTFLGWRSNNEMKPANPNLAWIDTITALGNRSKEDSEKSNYQAGTDFENIVRQSLEFLGFTIDYSHKGGAGGLDLFCSKPYPLVGECKAGKKIPNDTAVQLLNLGTLRLKNQELVRKAAKLIIGPGEPTQQLEDAAKVHNMAIINPETLEKLVKLQSQYPGSIDLFQLKNYLQAGQSNEQVENYIEQVRQAVKVRSHLVNLVKKHLENTEDTAVEITILYGAYGYSHPPQTLKIEEMHEILIELSSPLTGYLGRVKGIDWRSDRFYFLRDLAVDSVGC